MLLNCGVGEDSSESLGWQGDPTNPSQRKSVLNIHWKDWCWRWNSNTLTTWCEELTDLKRPWCWERLKAGGEGDDRGWDGWMASLTQWTWVWVNSGSWWWTGRPGVLQFTGSQRVGYNWVTELNWMNKKLTDLLVLSLLNQPLTSAPVKFIKANLKTRTMILFIVQELAVLECLLWERAVCAFSCLIFTKSNNYHIIMCKNWGSVRLSDLPKSPNH